MMKNDRRKKFIRKMKGGRIETDGRRESSKVRRDNKNIS